MKSNFQAAMASMLKWEGGFVNHPKDPGGATNQGVTQRVYDAWRRNNGKIAQPVQYIDQSEVNAIYRSQYWDAVRGDDLPAGMDYAVFDYAVNSGPGRAIRVMQDILNVKIDGIIGNITLAAIRTYDIQRFIDIYCDERLFFLRGLGTWSTFGKGWTNRVTGVRRTAKQMASGAAPFPPPPDIPSAPETPPAAKSGGLWGWLKRLFGF